MKKTRYTGEQIAFALRQEEAGTPAADIIRKLGVSEATSCRWKERYGGMGVAELRRLKQLGEENRRLKQLVADLGLDKRMLQDVLGKRLRPRPGGARSSPGCGSPTESASGGPAGRWPSRGRPSGTGPPGTPSTPCGSA